MPKKMPRNICEVRKKKGWLITDSSDDYIPASKSTRSGFDSCPQTDYPDYTEVAELQASPLSPPTVIFPLQHPALLTSSKRSALTKVISLPASYEHNGLTTGRMYKRGKEEDSSRDLRKGSSLRTTVRGLGIHCGGDTEHLQRHHAGS